MRLILLAQLLQAGGHAAQRLVPGDVLPLAFVAPSARAGLRSLQPIGIIEPLYAGLAARAGLALADRMQRIALDFLDMAVHHANQGAAAARALLADTGKPVL